MTEPPPKTESAERAEKAHRIDRLLDAIEFVKENQHEEACRILKQLIQEDSDFEDAWLWMSVAVDSLDQSAICLDNVLRINPTNQYAARSLHRIRIPEMEMDKRRNRLQSIRNATFGIFWVLVLGLLFIMALTLLADYSAAG